jgi:hypothetical protein
VSSSLEHLTFGGLRRDRERDWFRCSDLVDASQVAGYRLTRYEVRRAIAHLPQPEGRHYGHLHYGREHLEAVVAYATAMAKDTQETNDA